MESWTQCLGGCIFSCSRGDCIFFFQFPFWYFGIVRIWPMYHSLEMRIWFLIIFLHLKKSLTLFQMWVFGQPSIILSHMELSRIDLPKLTSSIFMEIVTIPVVLVDEFYFYMHHPIKAWLFEKIIFELVYLVHIVLKSLVCY